MLYISNLLLFIMLFNVTWSQILDDEPQHTNEQCSMMACMGNADQYRIVTSQICKDQKEIFTKVLTSDFTIQLLPTINLALMKLQTNFDAHKQMLETRFTRLTEQLVSTIEKHTLPESIALALKLSTDTDSNKVQESIVTNIRLLSDLLPGLSLFVKTSPDTRKDTMEMFNQVLSELNGPTQNALKKVNTAVGSLSTQMQKIDTSLQVTLAHDIRGEIMNLTSKVVDPILEISKAINTNSIQQDLQSIKTYMNTDLKLIKDSVPDMREKLIKLDELSNTQSSTLELIKDKTDILPSLREQNKVIPDIYVNTERLKDISNHFSTLNAIKSQTDVIKDIQAQTSAIETIRGMVNHVPAIKAQTDNLARIKTRLEDMPRINEQLNAIFANMSAVAQIISAAGNAEPCDMCLARCANAPENEGPHEFGQSSCVDCRVRCLDEPDPYLFSMPNEQKFKDWDTV